MDTFDQIMADTADVVLADLTTETVIYRPAAGAARTISAVIERSGPQDLGPALGLQAPSFIVRVKNDATSGISSSEVDMGGDFVELATRLGGATKSCRISRIVDQDAGLLALELK